LKDEEGMPFNNSKEILSFDKKILSIVNSNLLAVIIKE